MIKRYNDAVTKSNSYVDTICEKYNITNYKIDVDGLIDVDGDVNMSGCELMKIPLRFGRVTGSFNIENNLLVSLEGSPYYVGKNYNISNNIVSSLKYSPAFVGGVLDISYNEISKLDYLPKYKSIIKKNQS